MSDYTVSSQIMADYPWSKLLLADKGYDSNKLREALKSKNIKPCIPGRKHKIFYDKKLYKKRHKIENTFSKLKDWRRISPRYDRCFHTFFAAIIIAILVIFYLKDIPVY